MTVTKAFAIRAALVCALLLKSGIGFAAEIETQRALFVTVWPAVERGDWTAVERLTRTEQRQLRDYVLWPDLRAAWLRANLRRVDSASINHYLEQHGALRPGRDLRYRHALRLAAAGQSADYLHIYERYYQGLDNARLDCAALAAYAEQGRTHYLSGRGIDLWLVGRSQVDECDPVFEHLRETGVIDVTHYRQRFELAIEARNFTLARWLARSIDDQHLKIAGDWLAVQNDPERFIRRHESGNTTPVIREQLAYAVERITYADSPRGQALFDALAKGQRLDAAQEARTARHVALWLARDNEADAYERLVALSAAAQDREVHRWRARLSLRDHQWQRLLTDIAAMDSDEQQVEEWRYWQAVALRFTGDEAAGDAQLAALAGERSYYGFLAADQLGLEYEFGHDAAAANADLLDQLAERPALIRARELFLVGQDGRGRSEWNDAIAGLDSEERVQAAILADQWGWHSRAIAAVASAGEYDDLHLRYPLPYADSFRKFSQQARIPATWAFGVARSESSFMRDVRSSAGAIGLMQLMPATGRSVARELSVPFSGLDTLTDPDTNIRLGTTYLSQMAERYDGNRVLATAAYNAGPARVDAWLPSSGSIDAKTWIENIPFNETRKYVRRVLTAETIFDWRMNGMTTRLTDKLRRYSSPLPQTVAALPAPSVQ